MFIHLNIFKRKEEKCETGFSELTRKTRVEKSSRKSGVRPRTAPGSLESPTQAPQGCQSLQYDMPLLDKPFRVPVPLYAAAQLPTPRDEFSRPSLRRSTSSVSCAIRNPFRRDTDESLATIAHLQDWSTESVEVIPGTVPSRTPIRRVTPPCVAPQRAAIFTKSGHPSDSDETSSDFKSPSMQVVLARSKSLDKGSKISSVLTPVRPPLRRSSNEDIASIKRSSRRVY